MEKRYQVFVSSTYEDLKDERQRVMQTLMQMDCIPSGMELFPAADEDQFEFIKKVIDDCDYYLLIIGGRYGSTTAEGISYTEMEYDYAKQKGMKVVALLHGDPDSIVQGKTDKDVALAARLNEFRKKSQGSRLVKYWKEAGELPALVALGLMNVIKTFPAVGWVRATTVGSVELLEEINELRKTNSEMLERLNAKECDVPVVIEDIAGMDETIWLSGQYTINFAERNYWLKWEFQLSWNQIFSLIAPYLLKQPDDDGVNLILRKAILDLQKIGYYKITLEDQTFQTIKVQLKAYGLIDISVIPVSRVLLWSLTPRGEAKMMQLRTVRGDK